MDERQPIQKWKTDLNLNIIRSEIHIKYGFSVTILLTNEQIRKINQYQKYEIDNMILKSKMYSAQQDGINLAQVPQFNIETISNSTIKIIGSPTTIDFFLLKVFNT